MLMLERRGDLPKERECQGERVLGDHRRVGVAGVGDDYAARRARVFDGVVAHARELDPSHARVPLDGLDELRIVDGGRDPEGVRVLGLAGDARGIGRSHDVAAPTGCKLRKGVRAERHVQDDAEGCLGSAHSATDTRERTARLAGPSGRG